MAQTKQSRKKSHPARTVSPKKNVRSQRGVPETEYGETKKISSYSLTPTAIDLLKDFSRDLSISASELLERLARLRAETKETLKQEIKFNKTHGTTT